MFQKWCQCYNIFTAVLYNFFVMNKSVCPWQAFQPSLMFAGKAGAYSSEAPFSCSSPRVSSWPCPKTLDQPGTTRGRIFNCVRPFYERAVRHIDRSMHRSLWV